MASPIADFQEAWFLDTGATHHLSHNEDNLQNTYPYQAGDKVAVGNGKKLSISHVGSKTLHTPHQSFYLQSVFYVPHLTTNLISVSKFCQDNHSYFKFHPNFFYVNDQLTKKTLL